MYSRIVTLALGLLMFLSSAMAHGLEPGGREAQGSRRRVRSGGDADPDFTARRSRIAARWKDDAQREGRRRGLDTRAPLARRSRPRPKRPLVNLGPGEFVYFPSGATDDGRFLTVTGTNGTATLAGEIKIKLSAPSTAATLTVGIFDGDTGGRWDQGTGALEYTLFEDPNGNATGTTQVDQWTSAVMTDNAWSDRTNNTGPGAQAPSGNYFYYLRVRLVDTNSSTISVFKVRTNASVRLQPQNSFNVIIPFATLTDVTTIYPNYPSLSPTTFDGTFNLFVYVPSSLSFFEMWDGDNDFGAFSGRVKDTDDPNTGTGIPSFAAGTAAVPEGVASGLSAANTGNPPDDDDAGGHAVFRRLPDITYDVTDPNGKVYTNGNTSGNQEWEAFRIDTAAFNAGTMDYHADELPPGVYEVNISGLDIMNLDAYRFDFDLLGVNSDGNPVRPLLPYRVGDTVWKDTITANNAFDAGEGVAGVSVELLDSFGFTILSGTTAGDGQYSFPVDAGTYTVIVSSSNFLPAGPLAGFRNLPGGANTITNTVTTANVLTYDFGYRNEGTDRLGDRVWLDLNSDGVQDSNEPGIGGVTVNLSGAATASTVTDSYGSYLFTSLAAGAYTVTVDNTTLPPGLTPTYDLDGTGTAHTAAGTLTAGTPSFLYDFGYVGSSAIGDRVWNDVNNSYGLDGPDLGIGGVKMLLTADFNGDGTLDLQRTATTDDTGAYLFGSLPGLTAGAGRHYTVKVDTTTLPYGIQLISDPDDSAVVLTPNRSSLTGLAVGSSNLLQDFGYRGAGCIGGTLWKDDDQDGVIDAGETLFANVTVSLAGDLDLDGAFDDYSTSRLTDENGAYEFLNLPAGKFRVTVSSSQLPAGSTWSPTYDADGTGTASEATLALGSRVRRSDVRFGYRATATVPGVAGTVWHDTNVDVVRGATESGIPSVTVRLKQGATTVATTTTDSAGHYEFIPVAVAGAYTIEVDSTTVPAAYNKPTGDYDDPYGDPSPTLHVADVTVPSGTTVQPVDFGYVGACALGNFVWNDVDQDGIQDVGESGIDGVTVKLYNGSTNALVATATTAGGGLYSFTNLYPGLYFVTVTTISPYFGVTQKFVGADPAIDSNLDPSNVDMTTVATASTPNVILVEGTADNTIDAGLFDPSPATRNVGDFVWVDTDRDGVQDAGELGKAGVTVELYRKSGMLFTLELTTTTNGSGYYLFPDVPPGLLKLKFILPAGFVFSPKDLGGDDVTDSDADTTTGETDQFTVGAADDLSRDAGLIGPAIKGCVWYDSNRDGVYHYTEAGLGGVTIELYDSLNVLLQTTTTSSAVGTLGEFAFTGLSVGTYTVKVVVSSLPPDKQFQTVDSDDLSPPITTPHAVTVDVESGGTSADGSADFGPKACFGYSVAPRQNTATTYRTQTQGGWGLTPARNNTGVFLHTNFPAVYPGGSMSIGKTRGGAGSFDLTLTSAQAITDFLPQTAALGVLTQNHTNPLSTEAGAFAGQLAAAQLAADFSAAGITRTRLVNLKYFQSTRNPNNPFLGMTLNNILRIANRVLGGGLTYLPNGTTLTDLSQALDDLNNCFIDGIEDRGYYR